jgi:hypothetical protein
MKIVKQGFNPGDWKKQITCTTCNSVLEIEFSDIYKTQGVEHDQRDGEYTVTKYVVQCPVQYCKNVVDTKLDYQLQRFVTRTSSNGPHTTFTG